MGKIRILALVLLTGQMAVAVCGCAAGPKIAVQLPEKYNTPDGMVLGRDNYIYVSIPNFNNDSYPAKVIKIAPDNTISEVCTLPKHPETGKIGPLGIDMGPDGHLYIADNQGMFDRNDHKSRLLRVIMRDGKAVKVETLVEGMVQANAVVCHGDSIYITETTLDPDADPMPSGAYRFKYSEFTGSPVKVIPTDIKAGRIDKHLILTFLTYNKDWKVGANGMGFDSKGSLYVCNFGDRSIYRYTFDRDGNIATETEFAKGDGMESTDGIKFDAYDNIYVADFVGNAVHRVDPAGKVTTIWKNENNSGGTGGLLDKPSEVCLRDGKIYVANIDLEADGNEADDLHTISVIDMP